MLFEKAFKPQFRKVILGQIPPPRKAHTLKCCDLCEALGVLYLKHVPSHFLHACTPQEIFLPTNDFTLWLILKHLPLYLDPKYFSSKGIFLDLIGSFQWAIKKRLHFGILTFFALINSREEPCIVWNLA